MKAYAGAHREQVRATWKRFYQRHLETERERSRQRDPASKRESNRKWKQSVGLLYFCSKAGKLRAKQAGNIFEKVDYAKVVREANGMCGICRQPMNGEPAHIDHIYPISRGGPHVAGNVQLAHARCNRRKWKHVPQRVG
jgi:5-methylcytosine-specific restriction endonuclease McrA